MVGKKLLVAGCIVVGIGLVLYLPRLFNPIDTIPPIGRYDCLNRDVRCQAEMDAIGRVSLQVEPASLPSMQPLSLTVMLPTESVDAVSVQFVGRDMDMGLQPVVLLRDSDSGTHWRGEGVISLCTVNSEMVWLARLNVAVSGKAHMIEFVLGPTAH